MSSVDPSAAPVDARDFRRAMGSFTTGVAVVTTSSGGRDYGMPVNSLTSVSLDPPVISVCFQHGSATARATVERGAFAVNILGTAQADLIPRFMGPIEDRFKSVEVERSGEGLPLLGGSLSQLVCTVKDTVCVGDHLVMFGEVRGISMQTGEPLVFHRGQYGGFQDTSSIRDRFVTTHAGRVHLLEAGSGPPLVLLPSNGCSAHEYDDVVPLLARRYRVIAIDCPGQGDSDRIVRHHTIEMHGAAVLAVLDQLQLPQVHLVGTSVGGLIGLQLARDVADRLASLVLVDTPLRDEAFWAAQWPRLERGFSQPTQGFEEVQPRFRALTPEVHARWNIDRNKAGAWTMMDVMWAGREFDALGAAASVRTRTLALIGGRGPIADLAPSYALKVPGASVVVLDECGHFPMIDDPHAFAETVAGFLDRRAT